MTSVEPTVAELGELGIISSVVCPPRHSSTVLGSGDDSAVVTARGDRAVVSTDILVEGEHFRLDWSDPHSIGRRAIAQNAADIEAMGAHPTGYVVAIAAPRDTPVHIITAIGQGAVAEAHRSGADVVGGDFSSAQQIVICVTALGQLIEPVHTPVLQSGARPGDIVAIAGTLGWSAAGLDILSGTFGTQEEFLHHVLVEHACDLYRCPRPPYGYGARAAADGATAMTDVSDGLLLDLHHIARHSQEKLGEELRLHSEYTPAAGETVALTVNLSNEQLFAAAGESLSELAALCAERVAQRDGGRAIMRRWILSGGEDHGLVATFPAGTELPGGFRHIGVVDTVVATNDSSLISIDGNEVSTVGGWESFNHVAQYRPQSLNN